MGRDIFTKVRVFSEKDLHLASSPSEMPFVVNSF